MKRQTIFSGSWFEQQLGHSRAVTVGDMVFVSGTTGYDYASQTISDDVSEQTRRVFRNIESALQEAGASFADVVQIVTYYTDQEDWDAIGKVLREKLEGVHPVNTAVRSGLLDPRLKVEISAIAVRNSAS